MKRRRKPRLGCGCFSILLIPLFILMLYIGWNVYQGYHVDIDKLQNIKTKETYVDAVDMNDYVKNAFVAVEDKRFYKHDGVDWFGTSRAMLVSIKNGEASQGGSTITQQLAKTYFFNNEKSISRKIKEVVVAKRIENNYSKDDILSFYLNTIYYGDNQYAIEDAANFYFNSSVHKENQYYPQLNVMQSAMLASTINAPSIYDIENYQSDAALVKRTKDTLKKMKDQGYIDGKTYNVALSALQ